ncbi:MAG: outer membrane lipoprotein-sorting protein [Verrucomicrobiae bacterium]|nr:outer membrane lipoprotein-sorting protein [Verrucomicrobiae bacterium]
MNSARPLVVFAAAALLALAAKTSAFEDASGITQRALALSPDGNWMLFGALTTKRAENARPAEEVRLGRQPVTIQLLAAPDGTRQVVYRSEREDRFVRGLRFIFPRPGSAGRVRIMDLSGERPASNTQALFLGSAFTAEDLSLGFLAWKSQELLGLDTHRDRNCWRIVSRPEKSDRSGYDRVDCWVDQEYLALLRAIARDAAGNTLREFDVRSFQKLGDIWMLKRLDLSAPPLGVSTRLDIQDARREEP